MKLFVWDFHGVLEKGSEWAVRDISNQILEQFGYAQRFSEADTHRLYGIKWFEYFKDLLPAEPHERHLELQEACFERSNSNPELTARYIQPNDHAHEVLESIAEVHFQILISNSPPEALKMFLDLVDMGEYFAGNAFPVHQKNGDITKHQLLEDFLKDTAFNEIVVIGDSPSDIRLVSVRGGVSYLYAHPGKLFRECAADYRINDLRDVLQEI